VKKDKRREPFDRNKIVAGIAIACRKRPVSADQIDAVANSIEGELIERGALEVPTTEIGELVMAKLKEIDQVAYVRFASVYRQFKDVSEFRKTLTKLFEEKG
jgi:transcriptional repressor NrdR